MRYSMLYALKTVQALLLVALYGCGAIAASAKGRPPDYLMIAPRVYHQQAQVLRRFREKQGLSVKILAQEDILGDQWVEGAGLDSATAARQIRDRIRRAYLSNEQKLRYILLVGDAKRHLTAADRKVMLPTWYVRSPGGWLIATDDPYANMDDDPQPELAVGRLPVRSEAELAALVTKIIKYETGRRFGIERRQIMFFGGCPGYSPTLDSLIETSVFALLDAVLPPAYDIRGIYGDPRSAYCYPLHELGAGFVKEIEAGPMLVIFQGHGSFRMMCGRTGANSVGVVTEDAARIARDKLCGPLLCFSCWNGRFDAHTDCVGEAFLKASGGPVGVFASSRPSDPYGNYLLAKALLTFPVQASRRLGDLTLWIKEEASTSGDPVVWLVLRDAGNQRRGRSEEEFRHDLLRFYNLLGDPATQLMVPQQVELTLVETRDDRPNAAGQLRVTAELPFEPVKASFTFEHRRLHHPKLGKLAQQGPSVKRYELANQRVIARTEGRITRRQVAATFQISPDLPPGGYLVKLYAVGKDTDAMGGARWELAPPAEELPPLEEPVER